MRFKLGRKKPDDKVAVNCPGCKGAGKREQEGADGHYRLVKCTVCSGMGIGLLSRSKIKELDLTSLE